MGAICEIDGPEKHVQLAKDYLQAVGAGKSALVISPTHQEGEKVTSLIRSEIRQSKRIGADDRAFTQQRNLAWTEAERADTRNYREGLTVQFHQNAKGFKRGKRLTVAGFDEKKGKMMATRITGERVALPLDQAKHFQVYESKALPLASGARIRITQNGFTADSKHRLNNGGLFEVKGFSRQGDIRLTNGWTVAKDFEHLAHGYCVTSHNKAALREAVSGSAARVSATELMQKPVKPDGFAVKLQKQAELVNRLARLAKTYASRTADMAKDWVASYGRDRSNKMKEPQREREREI